jgi:heme exporter protein C
MRISGIVLPWLSAATVILLVGGLILGFRAPPDYQQGETVKIMFVHVPSAMLSMACYTAMAIASGIALVWRHPLAEIAAQQSAPLGAGFTAICLITGSLWGEPMWGTWWVWDARLTSELVLFFLYIGYIALVHAFDDPSRGIRAASVLALVGWINIPIIKFSVDWWNTLHQTASITPMGSTVDSSILLPLMTMALAFALLYTVLLVIRMRASLLERKIRALRVIEAEGAKTDYAYPAPRAAALAEPSA